MSKTKGGGSTRNGRDSKRAAPGREGVRWDGRSPPVSILVRQRGTKFYPGANRRTWW